MYILSTEFVHFASILERRLVANKNTNLTFLNLNHGENNHPVRGTTQFFMYV